MRPHMNQKDLEEYNKVVLKKDEKTLYPGPEQEGRRLHKFTLLKSSGNLHYSDRISLSRTVEEFIYR